MAVVIVMHIGIVYGLAFGLSRANVEVAKGPLEADIIEEVEEEEEAEPPPPPPEFEPPPPEFVPPPEISITMPASSATAITQVTSERKPPPPPPAPKAEKVVVLPKADPRRANSEPDYPPTSRRLGEEGSLVLLLLVKEDGKVAEVKVESSSGFERLDEAAVREASRRWKFVPGTEDGKPKTMWHRVKVTFKLTT